MQIAAIYIGSRIVTSGFFLLASQNAPPGSRFGAQPSATAYVLGWDAQYYLRIAREGYPSRLPLTDAGDVAQNAWAFMPLFPWTAGSVEPLFGSWAAAALIIAVVTGYLCCFVLHQLLAPAIGGAAALWAVVFFASAPVAAMFQVGYAEAPFLLLIMLGILGIQRRNYGPLYVIVPAMAFTRPGVLAFALFLGLFAIRRWISRAQEPLGAREAAHLLALGSLATALGFAWQVAAAVVTGRADAYLETELSWRRLWVNDAGSFTPFEGWPQSAEFWFPMWGLDPAWGLPVVMILVVGCGILLACNRPIRRLGPEIRLWTASYLIYLLAVFLPQSSIFRLLFPLSPLWGAVAAPKSVAWRIGVLSACLLGQWWWIWNMYGLGTEFWQIP